MTMPFRAGKDSADGAAVLWDQGGREFKSHHSETMVKSGGNGTVVLAHQNIVRLAPSNILSRGMQLLRDEGQDTADASAGRETAARLACEVSGEVMPPAAGTHRSDSGAAQCRA